MATGVAAPNVLNLYHFEQFTIALEVIQVNNKNITDEIDKSVV